MAIIYFCNSDNELRNLFTQFEEASHKVFEGNEKQRFKAVRVTAKLKKQILNRILKLRKDTQIRKMKLSFLEDNVKDQILQYKLSNLLMPRDDFEKFIKDNTKIIGKDLMKLYQDLLKDTKGNEYIFFWMLSEEEEDAIL